MDAVGESEALESKAGNGSRGLAEARGSRLEAPLLFFLLLLPALYTAPTAYLQSQYAFLLNACALLDASKPAVSSLVKGLARIAATRNLPPSCTTAACSTGTARKTNNGQK